MQNDIILSMADTVEDRDSNKGGHIKRTSECVRVFTEGLQNNPVYAKKGILSLNVLLRQHLFMILHNSDDMQFRKVAENVAHYHHEKWDGTGYPVLCGAFFLTLGQYQNFRYARECNNLVLLIKMRIK